MTPPYLEAIHGFTVYRGHFGAYKLPDELIADEVAALKWGAEQDHLEMVTRRDGPK